MWVIGLIYDICLFRCLCMDNVLKLVFKICDVVNVGHWIALLDVCMFGCLCMDNISKSLTFYGL